MARDRLHQMSDLWGAPSIIVEGAYATTSPDTEYDVWGGRSCS